MEVLKIYKMHPAIKLPTHATQQAACFDIAFQVAGKDSVKGYSSKNKPVTRLLSKSLTISPGDRMLVPTGMILDIPEGYSVRIHARSGLSLKQGLVLANAEGVIDSDYVEELFVMLYNISENAITITDGDRIAQGELVKNVEYEIQQSVTRPLPKGNRVGGLGSTGVSTLTEIAGIRDAIVISVPDNSEKTIVAENIWKKAVITEDAIVRQIVKRTGAGRPKGSKNKIKKKKEDEDSTGTS